MKQSINFDTGGTYEAATFLRTIRSQGKQVDEIVLQCACDGSVQFINAGGSKSAYFRHLEHSRLPGCNEKEPSGGTGGNGTSSPPRRTAEIHQGHFRSIITKALLVQGIIIPCASPENSIPRANGPFYHAVIKMAAESLLAWNGKNDWPMLRETKNDREIVHSKVIKSVRFITQPHMRNEVDTLIKAAWISLLRRPIPREERLMERTKGYFNGYHALTMRLPQFNVDADTLRWAATILTNRAKELLMDYHDSILHNLTEMASPRLMKK